MPFDLSKDLITLVQIFVSLFIFAQVIIVLIQNPKSSLNRSFSLFQFCVFVWMMGMGLAYLITDESLALSLAKIGYIGVSSIPITTYIFSAYFRGVKPNFFLTVFGVLLTAVVALNINNPYFVLGTVNYEWGNYMLLGPGGFVSAFLFIFYMSLFGRNLYMLYLNAERRKKWYLLAFIFGVLSFVGAVDFLPGYKIFTSIHPPGFIFVSVFSSFMGYFIIRYSLADIRVVLGRAVGHAVMVGLLSLIYVSIFVILSPSTRSVYEILYNLLFFISAVYLFNVFNRIGRKLIDEIFYKNQINFETKINLFEKELRHLKNSDLFLKEVFDFAEDSLRINNPSFLFINEKEKMWLFIRSVKSKIESVKIPILYKGSDLTANAGDNSNIIDSNQISQLNEISKEALMLAEKNNAIILAPLAAKAGTIGFMLFGKPMSGRSYNLSEKNSLKGLAAAVSLSWENVQLIESIERESRFKMDFVSIASHQLRTPLTRLKWALEIISSKPKLENDIKGIIEDLRLNTDNMVELVEQLLGVAEIEKKEIIRTSASLLSPVVDEVIKKKMIDASVKSISLNFRNERKDLTAIFSKHSLVIIIGTLLDNAIQYTNSGGKVDVSIHELKDNIIEIQIADNGIGIAKEEQSDIFGKFFRGNNAILLRPDGTGLGLYYAKILVEKQGGNIWFTPREGGGSVFHVTLSKPIVL